MKNTVITARRKKIELLTLLACFIIGNPGKSVCHNFL